MASVRMNIKPNWAGQIERSLFTGLLELATDVDTRAKILAPKDTRALVNSSTISKRGNDVQIKFGSSRVPYARKRHFENQKNPQTIGYLEKAGESVIRGNTAKYFRGKI